MRFKLGRSSKPAESNDSSSNPSSNLTPIDELELKSALVPEKVKFQKFSELDPGDMITHVKVEIPVLEPTVDHIDIRDIVFGMSACRRFNNQAATATTTGFAAIVISCFTWRATHDPQVALQALIKDAPTAYLGEIPYGLETSEVFKPLADLHEKWRKVICEKLEVPYPIDNEAIKAATTKFIDREFDEIVNSHDLRHNRTNSARVRQTFETLFYVFKKMLETGPGSDEYGEAVDKINDLVIALTKEWYQFEYHRCVDDLPEEATSIIQKLLGDLLGPKPDSDETPEEFMKRVLGAVRDSNDE